MAVLGRGSALATKLFLTFVAAWISFGLVDRNPLLWVLVLSGTVTALNWVVGDRLILPGAGNEVAALAEGVLGAVIASLLAVTVRGFFATATGLFHFGVLVAVLELFFHRYLTSERIAP